MSRDRRRRRYKARRRARRTQVGLLQMPGFLARMRADLDAWVAAVLGVPPEGLPIGLTMAPILTGVRSGRHLSAQALKLHDRILAGTRRPLI